MRPGPPDRNVAQRTFCPPRPPSGTARTVASPDRATVAVRDPPPSVGEDRGRARPDISRRGPRTSRGRGRSGRAPSAPVAPESRAGRADGARLGGFRPSPEPRARFRDRVRIAPPREPPAKPSESELAPRRTAPARSDIARGRGVGRPLRIAFRIRARDPLGFVDLPARSATRAAEQRAGIDRDSSVRSRSSGDASGRSPSRKNSTNRSFAFRVQALWRSSGQAREGARALPITRVVELPVRMAAEPRRAAVRRPPVAEIPHAVAEIL